MIYNIPTWIQI